MSHILEVTNLEVEFSGDGGKNISVDHVGFHVDSGEIVCIVGLSLIHIYRYGSMEYKRSGRSGVLLPRISLGLWQNFGLEKSLEEQEAVLFLSLIHICTGLPTGSINTGCFLWPG